MFWSTPKILHGILPQYQVEKGMTIWRRWRLSRQPFHAVMGNGVGVIPASVCMGIEGENPEDGNGYDTGGALICWQHLFLHPFLKDMQMGWHVCLLPRHMVTVIKDGNYVCDRLISSDDKDIIESTKKYLYRYGYEPLEPINIHDLSNHLETVEITSDYKGFIFRAHNSWAKEWSAVIHIFWKLLKPHLGMMFIGTTVTLGLATVYYKVLHYQRNDPVRLALIRKWDTLQANKNHIQNFLDVMGLFIEAGAPKDLFQTISVTPQECKLICAARFKADKNIAIFQKFLKQYCPIPIQVKSSPQKFVSLTFSS